MEYVWGALCGGIWGAVIGLINAKILMKAALSGDGNRISSANLIKTILDIVALVAVFLLRNVMPFNFAAAIVATAVVLSVVSIASSFKASAAVKNVPPPQTAESESPEAEKNAADENGSEE